MTRLASDPSVLALAKRSKELEVEIGRLWQRRRPAILAQLRTPTTSDASRRPRPS